MSTISTSIWSGYNSSKASRSALADARCPPPVSDMSIWIVPFSFTGATACRLVLVEVEIEVDDDHGDDDDDDFVIRLKS